MASVIPRQFPTLNMLLQLLLALTIFKAMQIPFVFVFLTACIDFWQDFGILFMIKWNYGIRFAIFVSTQHFSYFCCSSLVNQSQTIFVALEILFRCHHSFKLVSTLWLLASIFDRKSVHCLGRTGLQFPSPFQCFFLCMLLLLSLIHISEPTRPY